MPTDDADLKSQLTVLRAENERLRELNDYLRAQRKQYLDAVCGPADEYAPMEDEVAASLKDAKPLRPFLESLGVYPAPEGSK